MRYVCSPNPGGTSAGRDNRHLYEQLYDPSRFFLSSHLLGRIPQWLLYIFSGFVLADVSPWNEKGRTDPLPAYLFLPRSKEMLRKTNEKGERPFLQETGLQPGLHWLFALIIRSWLVEVKTDPQLHAFFKAPSTLKCEEIPLPHKKERYRELRYILNVYIWQNNTFTMEKWGKGGCASAWWFQDML